jgi:hypothetical protein
LPDFQFPQNQSKLNNFIGNDAKAGDPYRHSPEEIETIIPESIPYYKDEFKNVSNFGGMWSRRPAYAIHRGKEC